MYLNNLGRVRNPKTRTVEPLHGMYLNTLVARVPFSHLHVEPLHGMYLNPISSRIFNANLYVEPLHGMYLNQN